jgi:hypothetical protein
MYDYNLSSNSDLHKFKNKKLNDYIEENTDFIMNSDLVEVVKSLEKNSVTNIEIGTRERYCRKHLIPII